ncbi:MAG: sulfotransferase family 2 domain-containing protein, partial [Gammaproteobacteria bacterium]|nr:sulfotransferase family 2 domain-containing protein [Gammaproteobacteria bacterium]
VDLEQFIRWKLDPERPYQYHIDTSIQSQLDYLIDLRGKILVDFIGRYENLNNDFAHVCEVLGIRRLQLPHKREARDRNKDYRSYYSDALAELVENYFERDIKTLNYSFEPTPD